MIKAKHLFGFRFVFLTFSFRLFLKSATKAVEFLCFVFTLVVAFHTDKGVEGVKEKRSWKLCHLKWFW